MDMLDKAQCQNPYTSPVTKKSSDGDIENFQGAGVQKSENMPGKIQWTPYLTFGKNKAVNRSPVVKVENSDKFDKNIRYVNQDFDKKGQSRSVYKSFSNKLIDFDEVYVSHNDRYVFGGFDEGNVQQDLNDKQTVETFAFDITIQNPRQNCQDNNHNIEKKKLTDIDFVKIRNPQE